MAMREPFTAIVSNNNDPATRGRIKVICEAILGDQEIDEWAEPAINGPGWFFVPEVDDEIEIEVNRRIDTETSLNIRYRSQVYNDDSPVNDIFKKGYDDKGPKRMGLVTAAGHLLIFDNGDNPTVNVVHGAGTFMRLNADKSVNIGQNWEGKELVFMEIDKNGNVGLAKGALEGPHNAILGDLLAALFDAHTHPTGVGPSGPPVVLTSFTGVKGKPTDPISQRVKFGSNQG